MARMPQDGRECIPKDITPIAWKRPLLMSNDPRNWPLISDGTRGPCVITVIRIMSILSNARVLAFAS